MRKKMAMEARDLLSELIAAWNDADFDRLRKICVNEIVVYSPNIEGPRSVVRGIDSINQEMRRAHERKRRLKPIDVLIGARTASLLFQDRHGFIAWNCQLSEKPLLREISICFSVGTRFLSEGAPA